MILKLALELEFTPLEFETGDLEEKTGNLSIRIYSVGV